MLKTLKGYLLLGVAGLFAVLLLALCIGLYRVHNKLEAVGNLQVDLSGEKAATVILQKQDVAVAAINKAGETSTAKLQDILRDAHQESSERSQSAAPTEDAEGTHPPTVVPPPVATKTAAVLPPKAKAAPVSVRPSATTTRTINELWDNYCATFPAESSCNRQADSTRGVQASTTAK